MFVQREQNGARDAATAAPPVAPRRPYRLTRRPDERVRVLGGAMDLVSGAKRVVVTMIQCSRDGQSKLVDACSLPLTGLGCVTMLVTDLAVIDVTADGFVVRELAPGVSPEDFTAACAARHQFSADLKTIDVG